jgi:hypothetical protein
MSNIELFNFVLLRAILCSRICGIVVQCFAEIILASYNRLLTNITGNIRLLSDCRPGRLYF